MPLLELPRAVAASWPDHFGSDLFCGFDPGHGDVLSDTPRLLQHESGTYTEIELVLPL